MPEADHEETAPDSPTLIVTRLACSLRGTDQEVLIEPDSLAGSAYGRASSTERFMCSYGVNDRYRDRLFSEGLVVSGTDHEGNIRIVERPGQPFWMATLFVPQLSSRPETPHPLLLAFVKAAAAFRESR
jgi:CTP synthase (UTP-ammonia lyase)